MHIWRAYKMARWARLPTPDFVVGHFDAVADRLEAERPKSARAAAALLGFGGGKGGASAAKRAQTASDHLATFEEVTALMECIPAREQLAIFTEVAERRKVSIDYVKKVYYDVFPSSMKPSKTKPSKLRRRANP